MLRERSATTPVVDEAGSAAAGIVTLQARFDLVPDRVQLGQPGLAIGQKMKWHRLEQTEAAHAVRLPLRKLKRNYAAVRMADQMKTLAGSQY